MDWEGDVYNLLMRIPEVLRAFEAPGLRPAAEDPSGADVLPRRERLARAFERCERRLREGLDAPLRVAFFGPTGVGKSKLFNSLFGRELSPSGYRRPCTMKAVYLLHEDRKDTAEDLGAARRLHADDRWRHLLLVDTPDFDSVETQNRLEAERVLCEADALVFVTDVHKYGDQSTWEYLRRIVALRKPRILVLNKITSDEPASDFFSRVDREFPGELTADQRLAISRHSIDDHSLIPASDSGLTQLDAAVQGLVSSPGGRSASLAKGVRGEVNLIRELWAEMKIDLAAYLGGVSALREDVEGQLGRASATLKEELRTEVDAGVKADVFARVLKHLEKIDVLRYPRKLMYLPIKGVKTLFNRWFGGEGANSPDDADGGAAADDAFQIHEARVLALIEEVQDAFRMESRCPDAGRPEVLDSVRIAHDDILDRFRVQEGAFKEWLGAAVEETAGALTGEHKLKFILAQVLYNGTVIGVQISTGGLGVGEVVTDAVVSPLVAKAIGMAVSSERVVQFEKDAREKHHALLSAVLEEVRRRAFERLDAMEAWRDDFGTVDASIAEFLGQEKKMCEAFEAGRTAVRSSGGAEKARSVE